jgi:hypothetical protein
MSKGIARDPSYERVREMFDYRDGGLYWKVPKQGRPFNKPIGRKIKKNQDRIEVVLDGKKYKLHRLVWLWHHGSCPRFLKHIDGDPSNNAIENLAPGKPGHQRGVERAKGRAGRKNSTGYRGVTSLMKGGKRVYRAQIRHNMKQHVSKNYDTAIEAAKAWDHMAKSLNYPKELLNFDDPFYEELT